MIDKLSAVIGLYTSVAQAEEALDYLIAEQFNSGDISVVMRDGPGVRLASGTLGLLAEAGPVVLGGSEAPLIMAGPLRMAIGTGEATRVQRLGGLLADLGLSETEIRRITEKVATSEVLLSVQYGSSGELARALDVFKSTGAEDIVLTRAGAPETAQSVSGRKES